MLFLCSFFFFNDTATTEIYTLSLHDALPISRPPDAPRAGARPLEDTARPTPRLPRCRRSWGRAARIDRKSTRLNSSHVEISYAVFCLKKKKNNKTYAIPEYIILVYSPITVTT